MPEIRRAGQRFHTAGDGVDTWHSFSYGTHYDPDQIGFGPIMAINTEHIAPGAGYGTHRHVDVEIVTWVLAGVLRHEDSTGQSGVIRPGTAQRLSAGTGVEHSERNASPDEPLVFVQMMLRSEHAGPPEYAQVDVDGEVGVLRPTVPVHAPAELLALRLEPGRSVTVPAALRSLVLVTSGILRADGAELGPGDEARLVGDGEQVLEAGSLEAGSLEAVSLEAVSLEAVSLEASSSTTALVWQLHA